jgi:large subunit ribosomal protein L18
VATVTNRHVVVQLIDDDKGVTLAYVSTVGASVKGNLTVKATWAGEHIAAAAKSAKLKSVVFDRAGRIYHGRLNALAAAARKGGLEF